MLYINTKLIIIINFQNPKNAYKKRTIQVAISTSLADELFPIGFLFDNAITFSYIIRAALPKTENKNSTLL